ncbi:MAG: guanylate kinase [Acidobacteriota bacterium]
MNRFRTLSEMARTGNLIIVSGPSGAGKSVLVASLLQRLPRVRFSVSYTTRAPRGAERNGVEYLFVDRREFQLLILGDSLLEWAEVHGNYYGTSRIFVEDCLRAGDDVLLDIDVQGAAIVKRKRPDSIAVFILPPSFQILRDRLRRRSLDDEVVIEQRLTRARKEIRHYQEYDYLIINEDLGSSTHELESIILSARCRMTARIESAKSILATFGGMDAEDP